VEIAGVRRVGTNRPSHQFSKAYSIGRKTHLGSLRNCRRRRASYWGRQARHGRYNRYCVYPRIPGQPPKGHLESPHPPIDIAGLLRIARRESWRVRICGLHIDRLNIHRPRAGLWGMIISLDVIGDRVWESVTGARWR